MAQPSDLPPPHDRTGDAMNVRRASQYADMKERFAAEGLDAIDAPPEHLREVIARDVAKWRKVIAAANIPRSNEKLSTDHRGKSSPSIARATYRSTSSASSNRSCINACAATAMRMT